MSGPLRIGYVLETFPCPSETFIADEIHQVGECGAQISVFALRRGAGGLDPEVEVVYGSAPATCPSTADLLRVVSAPPREALTALRRAGVVRGVAAEVDRRGIAHLHAHFAGLPTELALAVARLRPVTVTFAAHARDVFVAPRGLRSKLKRARLCIACSDAAAGLLRSHARPADRNKITRIHHGTDLDRFAFSPKEQPGRPPSILAVGRLVQKKGFSVLLQACALLRDRLAFACRIVGDGPLRAQLESLARECDLEGVVGFPGWVPYDELAGEYGAADVLAVPSVQADDGDRDGLPNVVVEAMACGTPVVASDFSAIPEAVRHEGTGLLCPPGDAEALAAALERALTDAGLRASLVREARKEVGARFDCRRNARKVYEVLRRAAR